MNRQKIEELLRLANGEFDKGNFAEVESICLSALRESENQQPFFALRLLCLFAIIRLGRYREALLPTQNVLADILAAEQLELNESISLQAQAHNLLGIIYHRLAYSKETLDHFSKALVLYESLNDKVGIAKCIGNIGIAYQMTCEYQTALEYYQKSLGLYEELEDKQGIHRNTRNIGNIYTSIADFSMALIWHQKTMQLSKEADNKQHIADSLANIGIVYGHLEEFNQSIDYLLKALEIDEGINNKSGVSSHLGNIGAIYITLRKNEEALDYLNKAMAIHTELGKRDKVAHNHTNLGSLHTDLNNYPQAHYHFTSAIDLFEAIGHKSGVVMNKGNVGKLFAHPQFDYYNEQKAEAYFVEALAIAEEAGLKAQQRDMHKHLSALYKQQGKWQQGWHHFESYHFLDKEVQSEESRKQAQQLENRRKVEEAERDRQVKLARFQEQEKILLNILPAPIAERILQGEKQIADYCPDVSIFFSDIVGFTKISQTVSPKELVSILNEIFSEFDRIARKHGLEKIKTIGDAYMAVAGVPGTVKNHAIVTVMFALEVSRFMIEYRLRTGTNLEIRIGVHSGNAVAGVIGENKFAYDLWGDSVNTAARMEQTSEPGRINISESTYNLVNDKFACEYRGEIEAKNKGKLKMYFVAQAAYST